MGRTGSIMGRRHKVPVLEHFSGKPGGRPLWRRLCWISRQRSSVSASTYILETELMFQQLLTSAIHVLSLVPSIFIASTCHRTIATTRHSRQRGRVPLLRCVIPIRQIVAILLNELRERARRMWYQPHAFLLRMTGRTVLHST
jgi:hypothetical protein